MNGKLVTLLSCSLLLACGGEGGTDTNRNLGSGDGGAKDGGSGDGGADPLDGEVEGDAQVAPDAAEDAAQQGDDASVPTGFSITVLRGATPIADLPVWFHDATGALLSEHLTGPDGRVTSDSTPAMVTALTTLPYRDEQSGFLRPTTFTSLTPGDHIVLAVSPRPWVGNPEARHQLSYPEPPVGSYSYVFAGEDGCAIEALSDTLTGTLRWPMSCPTAQANSLLGIAAAETGEVLGYSFARGVPGFSGTLVPVTLSAWSPPGSLALTFESLPPGETYYEVGVWSEGVRIGTQPSTRPLSSGEETQTVSSPVPVGYGEQIDVLLHGMPDGLTRSSILVRQAPSPSLSIDLASRLPRAANTSIELGAGRPTFRWEPAEASRNDTDAVAVELGWELVDAGGESTTSYGWLVIAPPNTQQLTMPSAPALYAELQNVTRFDSTITYFDRSVDEGYRGFLKRPVRVTDGNEQRAGNEGLTHPLYLELPGVGVARATTYREE